MTENIPDQLEWYPAFKLMRCKTVSENMDPKKRCIHLRPLCPTLYPLPHGPVAERTKRDTVTDEYVARGGWRPAMPEICRDRFRDCGGQRQIHRGAVL